MTRRYAHSPVFHGRNAIPSKPSSGRDMDEALSLTKTASLPRHDVFCSFMGDARLDDSKIMATCTLMMDKLSGQGQYRDGEY